MTILIEAAVAIHGEEHAASDWPIKKAPGPLRDQAPFVLFFSLLPPNINANSRSMEFNARAPMVVVVSITHVEAITPLDTRCSAGAFTADLFTNTIRAGRSR